MSARAAKGSMTEHALTRADVLKHREIAGPDTNGDTSRPTRECEICGTEFQPLNGRNVTCGDVCSKERHRIRDRQRRRDARKRAHEPTSPPKAPKTAETPTTPPAGALAAPDGRIVDTLVAETVEIVTQRARDTLGLAP